MDWGSAFGKSGGSSRVIPNVTVAENFEDLAARVRARPLQDPASLPITHLMNALRQKETQERTFYTVLNFVVDVPASDLNTVELQAVVVTWGVLSDAVESQEQGAGASGSTAGLRLPSPYVASEPGGQPRRRAEPKAAIIRFKHFFSLRRARKSVRIRRPRARLEIQLKSTRGMRL